MIDWRDLRLSIDMLKIYEIEDCLFKQMKDFKSIGCFLDSVVERAHLFGMKDEERTVNMTDRKY